MDYGLWSEGMIAMLSISFRTIFRHRWTVRCTTQVELGFLGELGIVIVASDTEIQLP